MKGKGIKVFGVVMALLLVFSFAATFSVSSTSVVSAGTQKWTKISIPGTDDMQLAPGTDVGAIAVSPDGETLFAAVYVYDDTLLSSPYTTGDWYVVKSVDDGYTWKNTQFTDDGSDIVSIDVSPAWEDDGSIVVCTEDDAYISQKRGNEFQSMGFAARWPGQVISSFDIGLDNNGDATYLVGTDVDVYLLSGFSSWSPQTVYDTYAGFMGVLDVKFSPNYGEDGTVFAIITDTTSGTILRAETDIDNNNWGGYINDAFFQDSQTGDPIGDAAASTTESACMDFADDYNSAPAIFVGIVAYTPGGDPRGDAFVVDIVSGTLGTSVVTDLNVRRGLQQRTNVHSIAVAGSATSAFILVGLRDLSNTGPMTSWQGQVHYSNNGGESWLQTYKPPSGLLMTQRTAPILVMEPNFDGSSDNAVAYCANGFISGSDLLFSGVYVSTTTGTSFNGRGLLDHSIDVASGDWIADIVPSPDYDTDSTLFMVTQDINCFLGVSDFGLLWETTNGGSEWELILGMTTMIPVPGTSITAVEIPAQYPLEPSVFVTGWIDPIFWCPSNIIVRSTDQGNLFTTTIRGKYDNDFICAGSGTTWQLTIDTWKVIDRSTLIISNANRVWKTTDAGAHWVETESSEISASESIIDMQIWNDTTVIVGTDEGNVYMCQNWETDFSFTQVDAGPGVAGDEVRVAFDTNYDDNGMIYAGVDGTNEGVWRINANGGDDWENIWDDNDILGIVCDGNGILWAIADTGKPIREVNPTAPTDDLGFEFVTTGLAVADFLWTDLETAPTHTYVFAIGGAGNTELWAYIDTLIKPTLISPSDGATAAGTIIQGQPWARVVLNWEEMPKATWYEYEVAYDSGFGSIADTDIIEGTIAEINLYLGEQFYWRVRAYAPIYSQWSDTWSFTTPLGPASAKPVCLSPTEGLTGVILKPTLQWSSSVEATGWELMVAKNCDYSDAVVNLQGSSALDASTTAYQITQDLHQGTNYCWKVRGVNTDTGTMSPWSDTGTFTTLTVVVEEEEGTPVWVWVVIALSAVLLVGVVVLILRTRRPV